MATDLSGSSIVAIDGPAGSGKSTVARAVAERLGLPYVDTGAMYRAATLGALRRASASGRRGLDQLDDAAVAELALETSIEIDAEGRVRVDQTDATSEIRGAEVTAAVSRVSAIPEVRRGLVPVQRNLARRGGVLEGRDIGTVVFPGAQVKVFLTASQAERARRRGLQSGRSDTEVIEAELEARDEADSLRTESPLVPAEDAVVIETTELSLDQVVSEVLSICQERGIRPD